MDDFEENMAPLLYYVKTCASFQSNRWIQTVTVGREMLNLGENLWFFFVPRDFEIWQMALKNNRAPFYTAV